LNLAQIKLLRDEMAEAELERLKMNAYTSFLAFSACYSNEAFSTLKKFISSGSVKEKELSLSQLESFGIKVDKGKEKKKT